MYIQINIMLEEKYINYHNISNIIFRRPIGTLSLIRNNEPYEFPKDLSILLTVLMFYNLLSGLIYFFKYTFKYKILICITAIIIFDIISTITHFISDITQIETLTRRYDFFQKNITTTLHHIDVLDFLDLTSYELITWHHYIGIQYVVCFCFLISSYPLSRIKNVATYVCFTFINNFFY